MISVIIPTYNHEKYIAEAIVSCLNETLIDEILIGDDGSTDRTLQIVEEFAERYPRKIRNLTDYPVKNIGAHNRINSLCASAKNNWLAILNSDDVFVRGRFRNFEQFVRLRKPDLIYGNCIIINEDGTEIGAKYAHFQPQYGFPEEYDGTRINEGLNVTDALLSQNFLATTSNMVFTRSLFNRLGGFQPFRYIHDWDFALRASLVGDVSYCNSLWVKYRIHGANTISESNHKVQIEVTRMMKLVTESDTFRDRFASISSTHRANKFIGTNEYLQEDEKLCILLPQSVDQVVIAKFAGPSSRFIVAYDFLKIPSNVSYVYCPNDISKGLTENELTNLLVCATLGRYDFFTCSTVLGPEDHIQSEDFLNYTIVKVERLREFFSGKIQNPATGRIVRLPRKNYSEVKTKLIADVFKKYEVSVSGCEITIEAGGGSPQIGGTRFSNRGKFSPHDLGVKSSTSDLPVLFVFPSLLAVGGAENVLFEVLDHLKKDFRFVVICTARLAASQGSWLWRALEHAESVFELGEICGETDLLPVISWLKDIYDPAGLFITNSNMWQITNSYKIRRLFRDAAVIDQQAYDYKFGWIEWFDHPGVALADRFIAVNEKIRSALVCQHGISESKIDMIYHPIAATRISKNLQTVDRASSFKKFDLSDGRPVIAFVGRLTSQKRPKTFIELARVAQVFGSIAQFVMVGQGELQNEVETLARKYGLNNTSFIRNIAELEYFYPIVDILVITSEFEGVPLAMLEAMGAGVTVLSTDVGDIAAVLKQYDVGRIVDPLTSGEQFFEELSDMLKNLPKLKTASASVASRVLADFSGENISRYYRDTFNIAVSPYKEKRQY